MIFSEITESFSRLLFVGDDLSTYLTINSCALYGAWGTPEQLLEANQNSYGFSHHDLHFDSDCKLNSPLGMVETLST